MMVASFVTNNSIVADIGTDHAYLPVYLVLNGVCEKAIAADVGKGPLANAEATVKEYDLSEKIELVLSDGLGNIRLDGVDTVVLAGMGGDLISDILSAVNTDELKKLHIIAQPQSHAEKVRLFLMNNGFNISQEKICRDSKHTYICMSARYSARTEFPDSYEYYGELLSYGDELAEEFIHSTVKRMEIKRAALEKASPDSREAKNLGIKIKNILAAMEEI